MFRNLLSTTLLLCLGCITASTPAAAGVPGANSSTPPCISLVGTNGSVADQATGSFQVVVRDLANNPIVGANVVIDLSNCPDLHLCSDQLDPAMDVDCAAKRVGKLTDALGKVSFTLLGGSNGSGLGVELLGAGRIYENGTLIGSPTVSAYDLDGANGVAINDLSVWLTDFGTPPFPPFGRSEFDCNGSVGINDLSLWLTAFGSGTQVASCSSTCP